jgi:hypothetical protein
MKVSVITPVYNAAAHLEEAVRSVLAQTFADWELILVDDGSRDGSGAICDAFACQNVKVIHQENKGVSAARNAGIALARGKYLAFLDADDAYAPDFLAKMVAGMEGCELCLCGYWRGGTPVCFDLPAQFDRALFVGPFGWQLLLTDTLNTLWHKLFVRELVQAHGIAMCPALAMGEDREFLLRYLAHVQHVCCISEPLYYWRQVQGSAIRQLREDTPERLWERYLREAELFGALGFAREEHQHLFDEGLLNALNNEIWRAAQTPGRQGRRQLRALLRSPGMQVYDRVDLGWLRRRFGFAPRTFLVSLCSRLRWAGGVRLVARLP